MPKPAKPPRKPVPSSLIVTREQVEKLPEEQKAVLRAYVEKPFEGGMLFFKDCAETRKILMPGKG